MGHKKVVYILGPIDGVPRYWEAFEKAEDELTARGYIALSPSRLPEGMTPAQTARIRLAMLESADAVLVLPGFCRKDAALEYKYLLYTDKPYDTNLDELKEVLAT